MGNEGYAPLDKVCAKCDNSCKTCTDPGDKNSCLSCPVKKFLSGKQCVDTCPTKTALEGSTCLPCHESCKECEAPKDSAKCKSCENKLNLYKNTCIETCPKKTIADNNKC